MFFQLRFIAAARHNRHDDAALLHYAIGPREGVASDWIEHQIDIVSDLFEFLFRVIDRRGGGLTCALGDEGSGQAGPGQLAVLVWSIQSRQ